MAPADEPLPLPIPTALGVEKPEPAGAAGQTAVTYRT